MKKKASIITISSGKGGVGKSCVAVNLGILLAQKGYRTCLFDADANLANINIMLKLTPGFTLEHVLNGQKSLQDIVLQKSGLHIIPGGSGLDDLVTLTNQHLKRMQQAIKDLKYRYDYIIIDTPAGISKNILSFINISQHNLVVITPEPTSLTDAFSLIRVASRQTKQNNFHVIVNKAPDKNTAASVFRRFANAVNKYIGCSVNYLGQIKGDDKLAASVGMQNPVVLQYPYAQSTLCLADLCRKLADQDASDLNVADNSKLTNVFTTDLLTTYSDKNQDVRHVETAVSGSALNTEILPVADEHTTGASATLVYEPQPASAEITLNTDSGDLLSEPVIRAVSPDVNNMNETDLHQYLKEIQQLYFEKFKTQITNNKRNILVAGFKDMLNNGQIVLLKKFLADQNSLMVKSQNSSLQNRLQQSISSKLSARKEIEPDDLYDSIQYAAIADGA